MDNEMDELPDLSFDMSLLDDDDNLELCSSDVDADKALREVVNNDVSLLDSAWMNQTSVGKNINNLLKDLVVSSANPSNFKCTQKQPTRIRTVDSDTESLTEESSGCSNAPSPAPCEDGKHFGFGVYHDDELVKLSVKDLNSQVKDFPKHVVNQIKKRRRTLKNRGYAHSCRMKRMEEKTSLKAGKENLEGRNKELEHQVENITAERDDLRSQIVKYESILKKISQQFHCHQGKIMLRK